MEGGGKSGWHKRILYYSRLVGGILAVYGFFVLAYPKQYPMPYMEIVAVLSSSGVTLPATSEANAIFGFILFVIGLVLFAKKKPVF